MERTASIQMGTWFDSKRRKPLVLRGARQVGKSTLVRMFAQYRNLALYEVNLERYLYLRDHFRSNDPNRILGELQGIFGEIRDKKTALLFLDEIQAVPEALPALRYFLEDMPELAVVAAGSLLEFALADHSFSMPVGRISYIHLEPLSFSEFLLAVDPELHRFFEAWKLGDGMPESRHGMLLRRQREYLVVGGMPEAVQVWLESGLFGQVQQVQREILGTYVDDFAKYAKQAQLVRLQRIYRSIPAHLGQKIIYSKLSKLDRSPEVKSAVDLLCKARVCSQVYHSDSSGLPLGAGQDDSIFKLLFLDVGLVSLQLGLDWTQVQRFDERSLLNEGPLAEQFVGQELRTRHNGQESPELHYWLREGRSNNAELDYVIQLGMDILPIEVKAGKSGSLKSLRQFITEKKPTRALRFDLNPPTHQTLDVGEVRCELWSLPLYFAGRAMELLRGDVEG